MKARIPDLTADPCSCEACVVAGVNHLPVVRTPNGELHGRELAAWYREREAFDAFVERFKQIPLPGQRGLED